MKQTTIRIVSIQDGDDAIIGFMAREDGVLLDVIVCGPVEELEHFLVD